MLNERTLATRIREQGQICCLCRLPLALPHPMAERFCAKCSAPHRVYLTRAATAASGLFNCGGESPDIVLRQLTHSALDERRETLRRFKVTDDQGEAFEGASAAGASGHASSPSRRQYVTLKTFFQGKEPDAMHKVLMSSTFRKSWHICFFDCDRRRRQLPRLAFCNSCGAMVEFSRHAGGPKRVE